MNDFDYDCYLKKVTARSAPKRKCGAKSKRCTLPSDSLTPSQIKKLHGEVVTYQMKQPISWVDFKKMPPALQTEYIGGLVKDYNVTAKLCAEMFGVHPMTFRRVLQENCPSVRFRKGKKMSKASAEAWNGFLGKAPEETEDPALYEYELDDSDNEPEPVFEAAEPSKEEHDPVWNIPAVHVEAVDPVELPKFSMDSHMQGFRLNFTGKIDIDSIRNTLLVMLGDRIASGDIEICCSNLHNSM